MPAKPKSKIVRVEAQTLRIHPTAQRDIIPSRLKKLVEQLDLDAIGVLHAVEYTINGTLALWLIDGQHRWRALMEHGLGEWVVEVKVHLDAQDDRAASLLFLELNDRAAVSTYGKFVNEVAAGMPVAVGVLNAIKAKGLKANNKSADGSVCCIRALESIYRLDEGKSLDLALDAILHAWGSTAAALEGPIVLGVGTVFATYNGKIDEAAMVKKLAKYKGGPSGLIGSARGLKDYRKASVARCLTELVIETYNTGRTNGRLDPL